MSGMSDPDRHGFTFNKEAREFKPRGQLTADETQNTTLQNVPETRNMPNFQFNATANAYVPDDASGVATTRSQSFDHMYSMFMPSNAVQPGSAAPVQPSMMVVPYYGRPVMAWGPQQLHAIPPAPVKTKAQSNAAQTHNLHPRKKSVLSNGDTGKKNEIAKDRQQRWSVTGQNTQYQVQTSPDAHDPGLSKHHSVPYKQQHHAHPPHLAAHMQQQQVAPPQPQVAPMQHASSQRQHVAYTPPHTAQYSKAHTEGKPVHKVSRDVTPLGEHTKVNGEQENEPESSVEAPPVKPSWADVARLVRTTGSGAPKAPLMKPATERRCAGGPSNEVTPEEISRASPAASHVSTSSHEELAKAKVRDVLNGKTEGGKHNENHDVASAEKSDTDKGDNGSTDADAVCSTTKDDTKSDATPNGELALVDNEDKAVTKWSTVVSRKRKQMVGREDAKESVVSIAETTHIVADSELPPLGKENGVIKKPPLATAWQTRRIHGAPSTTVTSSDTMKPHTALAGVAVSPTGIKTSGASHVAGATKPAAQLACEVLSMEKDTRKPWGAACRTVTPPSVPENTVKTTADGSAAITNVALGSPKQNIIANGASSTNANVSGKMVRKGWGTVVEPKEDIPKPSSEMWPSIGMTTGNMKKEDVESTKDKVLTKNGDFTDDEGWTIASAWGRNRARAKELKSASQVPCPAKEQKLAEPTVCMEPAVRQAGTVSSKVNPEKNAEPFVERAVTIPLKVNPDKDVEPVGKQAVTIPQKVNPEKDAGLVVDPAETISPQVNSEKNVESLVLQAQTSPAQVNAKKDVGSVVQRESASPPLVDAKKDVEPAVWPAVTHTPDMNPEKSVESVVREKSASPSQVDAKKDVEPVAWPKVTSPPHVNRQKDVEPVVRPKVTNPAQANPKKDMKSVVPPKSPSSSQANSKKDIEPLVGQKATSSPEVVPRKEWGPVVGGPAMFPSQTNSAVAAFPEKNAVEFSRAPTVQAVAPPIKPVAMQQKGRTNAAGASRNGVVRAASTLAPWAKLLPKKHTDTEGTLESDKDIDGKNATKGEPEMVTSAEKHEIIVDEIENESTSAIEEPKNTPLRLNPESLSESWDDDVDDDVVCGNNAKIEESAKPQSPRVKPQSPCAKPQSPRAKPQSPRKRDSVSKLDNPGKHIVKRNSRGSVKVDANGNIVKAKSLLVIKKAVPVVAPEEESTKEDAWDTDATIQQARCDKIVHHDEDKTVVETVKTKEEREETMKQGSEESKLELPQEAQESQVPKVPERPRIRKYSVGALKEFCSRPECQKPCPSSVPIQLRIGNGVHVATHPKMKKYHLQFLKQFKDHPDVQVPPQNHKIPRELFMPADGQRVKPDVTALTPATDVEWRTSSQFKKPKKPRDEKKSRNNDDMMPKLEKSASSWASCRQQRTVDQDPDAKFLRSMKSIMNKLTIEKFDKLYLQLLECGFEKTEHIEALMKELFEKATTQHHFIEMYTTLCIKMHEWLQEQHGIAKDEKCFKRILLNECQSSFEKYLKPPESSSLEGLTAEEKFEKMVAYKTRMLGNMKLVGQLLINKMLSSKIIFTCTDELLRLQSDVTLETLCAFLNTIGPTFDIKEWGRHDQFEQVMVEVKQLSSQKTIAPRIRCLLQDVVDRQKTGWETKRKQDGPTTLAAVHEQWAAEIDEKEQREKARGFSAYGSSSNLAARKDDDWGIVSRRGGQNNNRMR